MDIVDFILNLVGLWLWLNGRGSAFNPATAPTRTPLLRTLKLAEPLRGGRWAYLVALGLLLGIRALAYQHLGTAIHWTPHLHLGVIAIPFASNALDRMLLFSGANFLLTLGLFYLGLLVLSVINCRRTDTDPLQKLVRLELGWVEQLPVIARVLLPLLLAGLLWFGFSPLFTRMGLLPPPESARHKLEQAAVMALATFPVWKYILVTLLLGHLLTSYVYLGNSPLWSFLNTTGHNLLTVLRWLPLRVGKVDLAPLAGLALVILATEYADRWLTGLFQRLPL